MTPYFIAVLLLPLISRVHTAAAAAAASTPNSSEFERVRHACYEVCLPVTLQYDSVAVHVELDPVEELCCRADSPYRRNAATCEQCLKVESGADNIGPYAEAQTVDGKLDLCKGSE